MRLAPSHLYRDGLSPAFGLDESGRMGALGLAWIVMRPEGGRPLILQKAGGLQGYSPTQPSRPAADRTARRG